MSEINKSKMTKGIAISLIIATKDKLITKAIIFSLNFFNRVVNSKAKYNNKAKIKLKLIPISLNEINITKIQIKTIIFIFKFNLMNI